MNKILPLLFVLAFINAKDLFGQNDNKYYDAYIINLKNDTIFGKMIKLDTEITSCRKFDFWKSPNDKQIYKAEDIKEFFTQEHRFEKVALRDKSGKLEKRPVLLVRLIDGPMILYRHESVKRSVDYIGNRLSFRCFDNYYIRKSEDETAHFVYRKNCEDEFLQINFQSKDLLRIAEYFGEVPEVSKKIKEKHYEARDLPQIVTEYNKKVKINNITN